MAETTQAELKDAIRFAGEMEKAFYAFRNAGAFLATYAKAVADEERSGPRREKAQAELAELKAAIEAAKGELAGVGSEIASAKDARAEREAAAEKLTQDKIAGYQRLDREALAQALEARKKRAEDLKALGEELAARQAELDAVNAQIEKLKKKFASA